MLVSKIVTRRARKSDADSQLKAFDSLLGAYRLDGHILGRELIMISLDQQLEAFALLPARDAFDPQFKNGWIEKQLDEARLAGLLEPDIDEIGNDLSEPDGCACAGSTSLILFTTYLQLQSPIRCGDCFRPVPLYRLPRFKSGEFVEVISWNDDYKACDSLFMNSTTGERFGYREMSQLGSSLSLHGRSICEHFEQGTGKATYYYLHRYYGRHRSIEVARKCPGCGGDWRLPEKWHNLFDFRCEKCRLVSCRSSGTM